MIPKIGTTFTVGSMDQSTTFKIVSEPIEDIEGRLYVLVDRIKKKEMDGKRLIYPFSMIPTSYGHGLTPADFE